MAHRRSGMPWRGVWCAGGVVVRRVPRACGRVRRRVRRGPSARGGHLPAPGRRDSRAIRTAPEPTRYPAPVPARGPGTSEEYVTPARPGRTRPHRHRHCRTRRHRRRHDRTSTAHRRRHGRTNRTSTAHRHRHGRTRPCQGRARSGHARVTFGGRGTPPPARSPAPGDAAARAPRKGAPARTDGAAAARSPSRAVPATAPDRRRAGPMPWPRPVGRPPPRAGTADHGRGQRDGRPCARVRGRAVPGAGRPAGPGTGYLTSPQRKPSATAWARSEAPSFLNRRRACVLTVSSERNSSRPISAFERP